MATFPAFEVTSPTEPFKLVHHQFPPVPPGHVRVKVRVCGMCHGDSAARFGWWPHGLTFPRVPGHEIAGDVVEVGERVNGELWKKGDRVAVGWFGGCCSECTTCRKGSFINCPSSPITGIHEDGGYAQYATVDSKALARIPEGLTYEEAAPLVCAGVTTYKGLLEATPQAGDIVGVLGVGGLGHLAIQFAVKSGYKVIAFSRGEGKREMSLKLGAHHYVDTEKGEGEDMVKEVKSLGGIDILLVTSSNAAVVNQLLGTVNAFGRVVILGAGTEKIEVAPGWFIGGNKRIIGRASGSATDSEDTLKFALLTGVRSINEVYPANQIPEAFERMMTGKAMFRVVVDWDKYQQE